MRIVVFGANGPTGRLVAGSRWPTGHEVTAVTRRPAEFPLDHEGLRVVGADVHDRRAVDRAVAGPDAVVSTLGVPFTRRPVAIYSDGIGSVTGAMSRYGVKRIITVSSSATYPHHDADGRLPGESSPAADRRRHHRPDDIRGYADHGGAPARKRPALDGHAPVRTVRRGQRSAATGSTRTGRPASSPAAPTSPAACSHRSPAPSSQ